ncbi:MAG TPA: hypothetical protein VNG69_04915 [Casimicrobiaceae bacterium]|nr:hypothetical protein [Casimicrobiaceae bacterium]
MKTTLEIPDQLFRTAKSRAAERGQTLKQLITEALQEKLLADAKARSSSEPAWMRGFGKLRKLHKETMRIQSQVDEAFEIVEPEDRT